jgi:hypothetical protein
MSNFDPKSKIMKMQGKDYLPVNWRIVWFREDHPKGSIVTELAGEGLIKATVIDGDGKILATGHGSPKMQGVAKSRPFEGAETAAIGRALAHAGYGTQFTDEDEGTHLADAPVEPADLITADAWEKWQALIKRADAVNVPHDDVNRAGTTKSQLRETYKELKSFVEQAEEQAKAA